MSSGPGGAPGLEGDDLARLIDRGAALGVERLYITGGEPFLRKDIFDLMQRATATHGMEVILLTNATLFAGRVKEQLATLDRVRTRFQVSIDGACPETNDAIRGAGTFVKALEGTRLLADLGFEVSLTTVTTEENLDIVKRSGATSQHLMWSHKRGRALEADNGFFPDNTALLAAVLRAADAAEAESVQLDNLETVKRRVNGVPGVKYDLGNAGWDSLCVYADGSVYPSAALANEPSLVCGDASRDDLRRIVETSPLIAKLRKATLAHNPAVAKDPFRFLTGGGDLEHAWCFTGDFLGADPYYPITLALTRRVMTGDRLRHGRRRACRTARAHAALELCAVVRRRQAARQDARVLRRCGRPAGGGALLPHEVRRLGHQPHPAGRHRPLLRLRLAHDDGEHSAG